MCWSTDSCSHMPYLRILKFLHSDFESAGEAPGAPAGWGLLRGRMRRPGSPRPAPQAPQAPLDRLLQHRVEKTGRRRRGPARPPPAPRSRHSRPRTFVQLLLLPGRLPRGGPSALPHPCVAGTRSGRPLAAPVARSRTREALQRWSPARDAPCGRVSCFFPTTDAPASRPVPPTLSAQ